MEEREGGVTVEVKCACTKSKINRRRKAVIAC